MRRNQIAYLPFPDVSRRGPFFVLHGHEGNGPEWSSGVIGIYGSGSKGEAVLAGCEKNMLLATPNDHRAFSKDTHFAPGLLVYFSPELLEDGGYAPSPHNWANPAGVPQALFSAALDALKDQGKGQQLVGDQGRLIKFSNDPNHPYILAHDTQLALIISGADCASRGFWQRIVPVYEPGEQPPACAGVTVPVPPWLPDYAGDPWGSESMVVGVGAVDTIKTPKWWKRTNSPIAPQETYLSSPGPSSEAISPDLLNFVRRCIRATWGEP